MVLAQDVEHDGLALVGAEMLAPVGRGLDRHVVGAENNVAIYIDGFYQAFQRGLNLELANVSQVLPAIHPYIGIDSLPAVNHQPEFAAATITSAAETAIAHGALALAGTVVDAATRIPIRQRLITPTEVP